MSSSCLRTPMASASSSSAKPKIKIQLDASWRDKMEGKVIVDGEASVGVSEAQGGRQAQAEVQVDADRQGQALQDKKTKAIMQASGPSAAPPPPPLAASQESTNSKEGSSSSDEDDAQSSSTRRRRSPRRKRRSKSALHRPPGDFSGAYPRRSREADSGFLEFKVKFAQVVDGMRLDIEEAMMQIPHAQLRTPTIVTFKTRAPKARVVENIDSIVPAVFRVYHREGTFRMCAPKVAKATAQEIRQSHRRRRPQRAPPTRPPGARPQTAPRSQRAGPVLQQAQPRSRLARLFFRSGVLDGTAPPDTECAILGVAARVEPAAVDAPAGAVTSEVLPASAQEALTTSGDTKSPCAVPPRAGRRVPPQRGESDFAETLSSSDPASGPPRARVSPTPTDVDASSARLQLAAILIHPFYMRLARYGSGATPQV